MSTLPVGVRDALRMYASWISCLAEVVALKCRWTWVRRCFDADEELRIDDMANRKDMMCRRTKYCRKGRYWWLFCL